MDEKKLVIDIFRTKTADDFTKAIADPDGKLETGSAAADAAAIAAAAWSCVEKMLHEHQRTSAPNSTSVSMSTAVWMVMCSDPITRTPSSGFCGPYLRRTAISPGISCSAISISLRPHSASDMSATL